MPRTSRPTKNGPTRLSEIAKHLVVPTDITTTGWPAVRKTCVDKLGITFDDWQDGAGRVILAKRADGNLAAMIDGVGMSLPRQVGKTYLIGALVFALCVNTPGLLVIWSAHHARTHGETFLAMQGFVERSKIRAHVSKVYTGSGDEEIRLHNRSRILFGARERGFGRGIPGVDVLIFDEAQILSDKALANMLATMNTSRFGLGLFIGTPPKPDDNSESFMRMRRDALEGRLTDGAWIEMGADDAAGADDREQWAKANPSYPRRTPAQSIIRLQRKLTPDDFLREGMGIWDDDDPSGPFSGGAWAACARSKRPPKPVALGLALDIDRVWISLAAATPKYVGAVTPKKLESGRVRFDTDGDELLSELRRISRRLGVPVVIDAKGPAASLIDEIEDMDVEVIRAGLDDYVQACATFYDDVETAQLQHGDHPELNHAVRNAGWRAVGDRRVWSRKRGDVSMLEAATLARWGSTQNVDPLNNIW